MPGLQFILLCGVSSAGLLLSGCVSVSRSKLEHQIAFDRVTPGAIYHLMNRGDRREPIFRDDQDRRRFLTTLGEACDKTGWQLHAWCLIENYFHLVAETPQAISSWA